MIGEAARIGNHVTLMQYVTLGGTGKESGDRHPKVGDFAQVAAHSTVLGAGRLPVVISPALFAMYSFVSCFTHWRIESNSGCVMRLV